MDDWVSDEFVHLDLGDVRVDKSAKKIVKALAAQPGASITQAFETSSEVKSCYEFFHNGKVTAKKILKPHIEATLNRIRSEDVILLPQDTSALNYSNKPSIEGLGNISAKNNQGLFIHPLLAITPYRVNLGIVDANIFAREQRKEKLTRQQIYMLPLEKKERIRWAEIASQIAEKCPETQVITIADREGDFAELFEIVSESTKKTKYAHIIVRGDHDRTLIDDSEKAPKKHKKIVSDEENKRIEDEKEIRKKLKSKLENSPTLGTINFSIPSKEGREGRIVKQIIKSSRITFKKRIAGSPKISMNVVMAIEESPPPGVEPLIWWFLTSLPIDTFEQSILIIKYYLCRWEIEVFFKILKSGCKVEERGITNGGLVPLIAIFLVIAWRIMYAMKLGRECPEISTEVLFSASEWKPVYKVQNKGAKLPDEPPKLGEFITMLAKLGGYLNRKNDPPPGPTVMWKGFNKMQTLSEAWDSFGEP